VLVAPQRATAGRLPFIIVVATIMVGGLVAVLLLHMVAAQDAFRITGQQARLATLTNEEQQQAQVVAADSAPGALKARAVALGMVPTTITKFHRRPDGRAVAIESPVYVPPPAPKTAHHKSTKAGKTATAGKTTKTTHSTTKSGKTTTTTTTTTTTKSAKGTTSPPSGKSQTPKHQKKGHANP
jgi:type II secretory pathway pseudopilin PulG